MNRLGSGSSWLTRCCCFEKSLVRCSAYQRGKKKINLGLSLVQGSQIWVPCSHGSNLSWHPIMNSAHRPGFHGRGPPQSLSSLQPHSLSLGWMFEGFSTTHLEADHQAASSWQRREAMWADMNQTHLLPWDWGFRTSCSPLLLSPCLWGLPEHPKNSPPSLLSLPTQISFPYFILLHCTYQPLTVSIYHWPVLWFSSVREGFLSIFFTIIPSAVWNSIWNIIETY